LQPSTNYEFYVQTNCSAIDQSQWSGPVSFTTGNSPCTSPSSLAANNVTENGATLSWQSSVPTQDLDHFVVEWGTQGFSPGFGDTAQVTGSSYTVSNLDPDQDYEFYVFTVCNSGQSPLAGSGSFTTLTTGLAEQRRDKLKVYPNPAENGFYVMSKQTTNSIITVYNVTGSVVYEKDITSTLGPVLVPTTDWPGGMYVIQLKKNEEILESERVVVR
jgi:hypothetical protein